MSPEYGLQNSFILLRSAHPLPAADVTCFLGLPTIVPTMMISSFSTLVPLTRKFSCSFFSEGVKLTGRNAVLDVLIVIWF